MENKMEKIISLAKRRGFIYPGSEIYGGLAGTWDYGPLGADMLYNIKDAWWKKFVSGRDDMFGLTSSIMMPEQVWSASGHLEHFIDPLEGEKFNTMFKSKIGALKGETAEVYLRPELAQGMFVNFKNIIDSFHPKIPFGIAQIGRCFRNEISPRDFLFRAREFDLMEFEYFVRPPRLGEAGEKDWEKYFEYWRKEMWDWIKEVGINEKKVYEFKVPKNELAHYSKRTIDFQYDFPFGRKELYGLAYRTDHDLKNHKLDYYDEETKERFIPHVIEPTFGAGRTLLALLDSAYSEDELGGERRVFLRLKPRIAPVKVAVFPLLANKPKLIEQARKIYEILKPEMPIIWDDIGNIGKRYRRQDEIGTPYCLTIDFETLEDDTVTIRDRDTGKQERESIEDLTNFLKKNIL